MARAPSQTEQDDRPAKSGMRNRDRDDDRRSRRDDDERDTRRGRASEPAPEDNDDDADNKQDAAASRNGRDRDDDRDQDQERGRGRERDTSVKASSKNKGRDRDDDRTSSKADDPDAPINLQDADENAKFGEIVPRAKYRCVVDDAEFKTFGTGSKGASIRLEISEGEYAADGKKRKKGKLLFTNLVCSAAAADILKSSLKALGVDKAIYNNPNFRPSDLQRLCDEGDLIGNEVIADVKISNYQGEKQNRVGRLIPIGAADDDRVESKGGFLED